MELSFLLMEQILSMVLMALGGFVLGRLKLITGEESRVLSCVCLYLAVPCSMITSFGGGERDLQRLSALGLSLAAATAIHVMYLLLDWLLSRIGMRREEQAMAVYSNAGNLVMPMVQNILGQEYVLFTGPYMLVQNLFMWTHGQRLMGGEGKLTIKKLLTTPAIASLLVGLFLFGTGITIPGPLDAAMRSMAGSMAPLSMLVVGIMLSELDVKELLHGRRIYWMTGARLVLYPLLAMGVLLLLGRLCRHADKMNVLTVSLLCSIGPTASIITQMGQLFHNPRAGYISAVNVMTTVLCAVTMPLITALFLALL